MKNTGLLKKQKVCNAFIHSCVFGRLVAVQQFLKDSSIDVNASNDFGQTGLHLAASQSRVKVVGLLLEHSKINVNVENIHTGGTALTDAAWNGRVKVIKLLLAHPEIDLDPIDRGYESPGNALHLAAENNHLQVVKLLLAHPKIKVNHNHKDILSALERVAYTGCVEIMKLLLAHGAAVPNKIYDKFYHENAFFILENWKTHLPKWSRFGRVASYYPKEFNQIAFQWLLVCKRLKPRLVKDLRYLMLEYIAEVWKFN